jgi:hypothetical protein
VELCSCWVPLRSASGSKAEIQDIRKDMASWKVHLASSVNELKKKESKKLKLHKCS